MVVVSPVAGQAADLRPVPDYFAEAIFASTMATSLAEICDTVEISVAVLAEKRTELIDRLTADGFDGENAMSEMQDPTGKVHRLQADFLEKYPLDAKTSFEACQAAFDEIDAGTLIGSLLTEVEG